MILKNLKIYDNGILRKGVILIADGIIKDIIFNPSEDDLKNLSKQNVNNEEINCQNKIAIPGIIDIHSHLRDLEQSEKETFLTGTKAAACAGITTVFNMPNTLPPAITAKQVKRWMEKAEHKIYVDVGFIAGVPKDLDLKEIKTIIDLGVIGFKIYPLSSLNGIDWTDHLNIQKLLHISSLYHIPIFIHADWPLSEGERDAILHNYAIQKYSLLKLHNNLHPCQKEAQYVNFILENYYKIIVDNDLQPNSYPLVHFCHISCRDSFSLLIKAQNSHKNLRVTFEITPHHLLLSNTIELHNINFGKVLPPLRDEEHAQFLFTQLKEGNIQLIGTDHAPHTIQEKSKQFYDAPSGFPGFESYPILLLDKVCRYELSLENFVKTASENPARLFNLKRKGFIKESYDADILIIDTVPDFLINPEKFKTKAKFSPFCGFKSSVQIWKVFLRGYEVNNEDSRPNGRILKGSI